MTSPCEWSVDEDCLPDAAQESDAESNAALNAAKDMAVSVLWALSGRQFGRCEVTARPCPEQYHPARRRVLPSPYEVFSWRDGWAFTGCGCGSRCRRTGPGMAHLPGPASNVISVVVDGEELDEDQYVLEDNVLYRIGDSTVWPQQDMSRPSGEAGTLSQAPKRGRPVRPHTRRASEAMRPVSEVS